MNPFLRLPGFAGISKKVSDMVSRFVAVPVVIPFEECIQTFGEAFFSAYMFDQPGYVLRNVPSIVVGCAFANEECERERVERFDPASVGMASTA